MSAGKYSYFVFLMSMRVIASYKRYILNKKDKKKKSAVI